VNLASGWCHRRLGLALTAAALLTILATPPAGAASARTASATAPATTTQFAPTALSLPPGGIGEVSGENLDQLLGEGALGAGGVSLGTLEAPLLAKQLSRLSGISELAGVDGLGGDAGVEQAMLRAIETLAGEGELVEELVGGFGLVIDFEEQLEATYEASEAAHQPGAPETLEEAVEEALHRSPEEAIDEGLESVTLGEVLSTLLGKAAHPEALAEALFDATEPEELAELLGTTLSHEPFVRATAAEAAAAIGVTTAQLAEKLGKTSGQLPASAVALFTPLHNGQQLGVFAAKKGLAFGLVGEAPPSEEPDEVEEEPLEQPAGSAGEQPVGKSSGSAEAAGVSSGTPSASSASVASTAAPPVPKTTAPPAVAKIRILAHPVNGATVTLVLGVAGAGRLAVSGHGIAAIHRSISHAARLSVRLTTTRAAGSSLRKHHRLTLTLHVAFVPAAGAASVASTSVTLH
jgi:hypothetical protein